MLDEHIILLHFLFKFFTRGANSLMTVDDLSYKSAFVYILQHNEYKKCFISKQHRNISKVGVKSSRHTLMSLRTVSLRSFPIYHGEIPVAAKVLSNMKASGESLPSLSALFSSVRGSLLSHPSLFKKFSWNSRFSSSMSYNSIVF